ncbi:MAG: SIS domain-containing protein [marine benthic group bacterium]|jgi:D-sedoheptulose 7-phosphate isomerase|nr:SIS domain-containing protein [Gemmatimonadota bacterium]MCL7976815.1 SIS domain-containing protein [Gemmatimonadota bacterium]
MMNSSQEESVQAHLEALIEVLTRSSDDLAAPAASYAALVIETFERDGRMLMCGNGGSAATVEHVATEYVVRLKRERQALPAIALTAGSAQLTASANDYGYEMAFIRLLRAFGRKGDLLVMHSTSGESANLLAAAAEAGRMGVGTVALLGKGGGRLAELVDLPITVPASDTARIQEVHLAIEHAVADIVDAYFADRRGEPEVSR